MWRRFRAWLRRDRVEITRVDATEVVCGPDDVLVVFAKYHISSEAAKNIGDSLRRVTGVETVLFVEEDMRLGVIRRVPAE